MVAQGDTRTDASGQPEPGHPRRPAPRPPQPAVERRGRRVATSTTSSISGRTVVSVHKGLFYIGLRGPSSLVVAGQPARLDLLTLGQDGTTLVPRVPLDGRALPPHLSHRHRAERVGLMPQWLPVDTLLYDATRAATGANARGARQRDHALRRRVPRRRHGARRARQPRAQRPLALRRRPRRGGQPVGQSAAGPHPLVPDRRLYRVGDVARVLVAAPRPGMTALVTIERGRVYSHQVLRLSGASPISARADPAGLPAQRLRLRRGRRGDGAARRQRRCGRWAWPSCRSTCARASYA